MVAQVYDSVQTVVSVTSINNIFWTIHNDITSIRGVFIAVLISPVDRLIISFVTPTGESTVVRVIFTSMLTYSKLIK